MDGILCLKGIRGAAAKTVLIGAIASAFCAIPVAAETLPVAGIYPAGNDNAAALDSIAIENFDGEGGAALSFAIADALDKAVIDGQSYFQVVPADDGWVDGVMRGSVGVDIIESALDDRKVTKCRKRNADEECIREKVIFYECAQIDVSIYPRVRLIAADGTEVYKKRESLTASESYCENDYSEPSIRDMQQGLVDRFASSVRHDLAPVFKDQKLRIMESRRGLNREDRQLFREAVRLTKTNIGKACQSFAALEIRNPDHVSVLFNNGLCAEGQADLMRAENYYRRALSVEPNKAYPNSGLQRIAERRQASRQLEVHWASVASRKRSK